MASENGSIAAEPPSVLSNITNTSNAMPSGDAEVQEDPAAKGWVAKTPYDYNTFNASIKDIEAGERAGEVEDWAAGAQKYEWSDDFGDIGPAVPELEKQLFGDGFSMRSGIEFSK